VFALVLPQVDGLETPFESVSRAAFSGAASPASVMTDRLCEESDDQSSR
jgi:hypothetical protein